MFTLATLTADKMIAHCEVLIEAEKRKLEQEREAKFLALLGSYECIEDENNELYN